MSFTFPNFLDVLNLTSCRSATSTSQFFNMKGTFLCRNYYNICTKLGYLDSLKLFCILRLQIYLDREISQPSIIIFVFC
jgi:hypothetical protein